MVGLFSFFWKVAIPTLLFTLVNIAFFSTIVSCGNPKSRYVIFLVWQQEPKDLDNQSYLFIWSWYLSTLFLILLGETKIVGGYTRYFVSSSNCIWFVSSLNHFDFLQINSDYLLWIDFDYLCNNLWINFNLYLLWINFDYLLWINFDYLQINLQINFDL